MDSLSKVKRRRLVILSAVSFLLAGLVIYGVMRPDPEEREYNRIKDVILTGEPGGNDQETRREFRRIMEKLKPETRERLMTEIMRERLSQAREKIKDMNDEQKREKIATMVSEVRERFSKLGDKEREKIKADMKTEEGKKRFKRSIDFYYTEFTSQERNLMDPLVNEIMVGLNSL
ncbi:MAG: hypothetical protein WCP55_07580 [Lentisphaerota bacterium]|jgi:hypothetical protein